MAKVNMMQALGIQPPDGPTKAPPDVERRVMQLACKYMLYERRENTVLSLCIAQLVEERHKHFHERAVKLEVPWTECSNEVCREAKQILASATAMEVNISAVAATLMNDYVVSFMPSPNNMRLWLMRKDEAQLPRTAAEKKEVSRIILPD